MQNPRLATRYAKSLLDLAVEQNRLEAILRDMSAIHRICLDSHEFELMLRSPVVSGDKKLAVVFEVLERYTIDEMTRAFIHLLITKGRELNLPEIADAFITQYNAVKNIKTVRLTTASVVNEATRNNILVKIAGSMPGDTIKLVTAVDESLIGGFVLEMEDKLYDASIRKNLNDIKTRMIDYSYVSKL